MRHGGRLQLESGDAAAACERAAGRLRPAPAYLHYGRRSRGGLAARPGLTET